MKPKKIRSADLKEKKGRSENRERRLKQLLVAFSVVLQVMILTTGRKVKRGASCG